MIELIKMYPNPRYGHGAYRRRIHLTGMAGKVEVALEDDYHAFRLTLRHDGDQIVAVEAESLRVPANTCTEAPALLTGFVGQALTADRERFRSYAEPRSHCTHLYDLLWLACAHALRPPGTRSYDVVVPDANGASGTASIARDGETVHDWTIDRASVLAPPQVAGLPLMRGFARAAASAFSSELFEAACVLQMGIFVARGRRIDVEALPRDLISPDQVASGACYSFGREVSLRYVRNASCARDFSDTPERLLQFL